MLPLHGQSTAAVKTIHWAGPTPHNERARSHVFDKQAEYKFAEFLFSIYNFYILDNLSIKADKEK